VPNGVGRRGYFDKFKKLFSEEEMALLNVEFFDEWDLALDDMAAHAVELGYKLNDNKCDVADAPQYITP